MSYKNIFKILLFTIAVPYYLSAQKSGYSIKIKVNGLKDTTCFLANYYADKQYLKDTAKVDSKGNFVFDGKEDLPGGIYSVVLNKQKMFEFLINKEQSFSLESDTIDYAKFMKIKGSDENKLFYDYLRYINDIQRKSEALKAEMKKHKENKDSTKILQEQSRKIDNEVKDYKINFLKKYPKTFLAQIFRASSEPEIPETPTLANGQKDSLFAYKYFKQHFFDSLDFNDERLLRTPIFHAKIKQYMTTLVIQVPDSIIKESDILIDKAKDNKEVFKYLVWFVTNTYEQSNIMGMDAVFVHMADKYYLSNKAYWVTPAQIQKIAERVAIVKPLLLWKHAPDMILQDTTGKSIELYDLKSKYTIVYFWDPDCGHCQKITPKLYEYYVNNGKTYNFEVYSVYAENKEAEWKKYIKEKKLNWINIYDKFNRYNLKSLYDIYSTPVIYILDKDKKIIAKRLGVENLEDFFKNQLKKEELEKKNK